LQGINRQERGEAQRGKFLVTISAYPQKLSEEEMADALLKL